MSRTDIEINIASNSYIDTFARILLILLRGFCLYVCEVFIDTFARFVRLKVNEKTGV